MTDDEIAAKYGGTPASVSASSSDDAIAAKYGGKPAPETAKPRTKEELAAMIQSTGLPYGDAIAHGMRRTLLGAGQGIAHLFGGGSSIDQAVKDEQAAYDAAPHLPGSGVATGIGEAANFVALPGAGIPTRLAQILKAAPVLGGAAAGAVTGAVSGAVEPVAETPSLSGLVTGNQPDSFASQKAKQIGVGAGAGAAMSGAFGLAGKVLDPAITAGAKMLQDAGIRLTPGQALGGVYKTLEDKAQRFFPILGDLIESRRNEGVASLNRAMYAKATAPFGAEGAAAIKDAPVGREGVAKVGDYLSSKYEQGLAASRPVPIYDNPQGLKQITDGTQPSQTFMEAIDELKSMVPTAKAQDFEKDLKRAIFDKVTPAGTLTPTFAKQADSELGQIARFTPVSRDEQLYKSAIMEARSQLREQFAKYNPETAPMIRAADQGWRTLVQIENAAAMLGAKDGVFGAAQLLHSVKKSDTSIRDRMFARGEAHNQEFADAARNTMSAAQNTGGLGGMIAGDMMMGGPMMTGITGAGSVAYLPGVNQALTALLTRRPQQMRSLGDVAKRLAPVAGLSSDSLTTP
jgi:hypothetical protein